MRAGTLSVVLFGVALGAYLGSWLFDELASSWQARRDLARMSSHD